ncbi:zinc-binding alcohol dehydrogenase family protein, partial [Phanerochaete sordida]
PSSSPPPLTSPADIKGLGRAGTICGCDWSGHVVATGADVAEPALGTHVAGFVHGGTYADRGAFAQYVVAGADLCWAVPPGTLTHEQAASMGCGYWTAVQALFHPDRLGLVEVPERVRGEEWVLVYGGSGSVGLFAIQLAHLAGYKVVTTASPRNHALCKSLGADAVIDYNAPDAIEQIKAATGDTVRAALDAISEPDTQAFCVRAVRAAGGKLVTILGVPAGVRALRREVAVQNTLIYTALGRGFVFAGAEAWPASAGDRAHMARFLRKTPELVRAGSVLPNPTRLFEGGLEGIGAGLRYMEEGKHSGEKIVYRLED